MKDICIFIHCETCKTHFVIIHCHIMHLRWPILCSMYVRNNIFWIYIIDRQVIAFLLLYLLGKNRKIVCVEFTGHSNYCSSECSWNTMQEAAAAQNSKRCKWWVSTRVFFFYRIFLLFHIPKYTTWTWRNQHIWNVWTLWKMCWAPSENGNF